MLSSPELVFSNKITYLVPPVNDTFSAPENVNPTKETVVDSVEESIASDVAKTEPVAVPLTP